MRRPDISFIKVNHKSYCQVVNFNLSRSLFQRYHICQYVHQNIIFTWKNLKSRKIANFLDSITRCDQEVGRMVSGLMASKEYDVPFCCCLSLVMKRKRLHTTVKCNESIEDSYFRKFSKIHSVPVMIGNDPVRNLKTVKISK